MPYFRKKGTTDLVDETGNPIFNQREILASQGYNLDRFAEFNSPAPNSNNVYGGVNDLTTYKDANGNIIGNAPRDIPTAANGFGTGMTPEGGYQSPYDQAILDRYQASQAPVDRDAIRKQKISEFQAQIDATNQIYTNLIARADVAGADRMGQGRALASRGGTLNSGRGRAQLDSINRQNMDAVGGINDTRAAQITSIMTQAQNKADEEILRREEAKRLGADQYLAYLAGTEERKAKNASAVLQSLLSQGLKLEDIPPAQFTEIANSLRMTPDELKNIYKGELSKAQSAQAQAELENYNKALETNLKYGIEGKYFLQGGLVRRSADGKPLTKEELFAELGVTDWSEIPEGAIDTSLSTPEDRELAQQNYQFLIGQDLKEREFGFAQDKFGAEFGLEQNKFGLEQDRFGFDQAKFGAEFGLEEDKFEFDKQYKNQQLEIDWGKLDIEQKKLLAEGSSKPLTAQELQAFGGLPAGTTWEDIKGMSPNPKLSAEEKKLNSITTSAFDALETIKSQLFDEKGNLKRNVIVGSGLWARTYGTAVNNLTDLIGRLRSGGAITKDEEKRFRTLLPSALDSKATIEYKLKAIEKIFSAINPADPSQGINNTESLKQQLDGIGGADKSSLKAPAGTSKTLASIMTAKFPAGSTGGQCGNFARKVVNSFGFNYPRLGDSLSSKMSVVKKHGTSIKNAVLGSVIVTKENPTYGHVAVIIGKNNKGYIVAESNFKQSNKVSYGRVIPFSSNKIVGVINPTKTA